VTDLVERKDSTLTVDPTTEKPREPSSTTRTWMTVRRTATSLTWRMATAPSTPPKLVGSARESCQ
jgi:hypothetical protein